MIVKSLPPLNPPQREGDQIPLPDREGLGEGESTPNQPSDTATASRDEKTASRPLNGEGDQIPLPVREGLGEGESTPNQPSDTATASRPLNGEGLSSLNRLWQALHDVEDPEFPMSIVDMGLVVDIQKTGRAVSVKMTFTAMGCPCIDMIIQDTRARLLQEPDVDEAAVEVVWSPVWTKERMTEQGKELIQLYGVSI